MKYTIISAFLIFLCIGKPSTVFAQVNTERVIVIGQNALYHEDYILAIQYFTQVINAKPNTAEAYYYRAIAKYFLEDLHGAEADCSQAISLNPFITNAYQLRGDIRLQLDQYEGAKDDLEKALKEMPSNRYLLVNLGVIDTQLQNFQQAEDRLNTLIKTHPQYQAGYLALSNLKLEEKDTTSAVDLIEKAIEIDSMSSQSYAMRANIHIQQQQLTLAEKDLTKAIDLAPNNISNYINRGLTRYYQNNLRGAMSDYDKVIEIEPNNTITRFNRGLLRAQVGDDNRAIEDFDVVIQQENLNYIAYYNRAILKNNIADYKGALSDINKVIDQHPNYPQIYYLRAQIYRRLRQNSAAIADENRALDIEEYIQKQLATTQGRKQLEEQEKQKANRLREIRKESNNDINKFNLLVVEDKQATQKNSQFERQNRGRVQDNHAPIQFLAPFFITFNNIKLPSFTQYPHNSTLLDSINNRQQTFDKLRLSNTESPLTQGQIDTYFHQIEKYSQIIATQKNATTLFARAVTYLMLQDLENAQNDLIECLNIDNNFALAHFTLALVASKSVQVTQNSLLSSTSNGANNSTQGSFPLLDRNKTYEYILNNYTTAIELAPSFAYSLYNRAGVKASIQEYQAAIEDYNKAIEISPIFAEAYYNRGLCKLFLRQNEEGLSDLRKAGELGIVEAYNIIKRMNNS